MWIKRCNIGGNCLPNSLTYKSHSTHHYTQGANQSLPVGYHQYWLSASKEREGCWPREEKTCRFAISPGELWLTGGSGKWKQLELGGLLDVVAEPASTRSGLEDLSKHASTGRSWGSIGKGWAEELKNNCCRHFRGHSSIHGARVVCQPCKEIQWHSWETEETQTNLHPWATLLYC